MNRETALKVFDALIEAGVRTTITCTHLTDMQPSEQWHVELSEPDFEKVLAGHQALAALGMTFSASIVTQSLYVIPTEQAHRRRIGC